jgi:hypothetical protein
MVHQGIMLLKVFIKTLHQSSRLLLEAACLLRCQRGCDGPCSALAHISKTFTNILWQLAYETNWVFLVFLCNFNVL